MKRTPLRRGKGLRPVSRRRGNELRAYSKTRKDYLAANPRCACCGEPATDIHHRAGRNGKWLNDVDWWLGVCRRCHETIHKHPKYARDRGWLI